MAQSKDWYPSPTGDAKIDETHRIIFDNLYHLRTMADAQNGNVNLPLSSGLTGTAFFKNGFTIAANNASNNNSAVFHNLIFSKGMIVGMS